MAAIIALEDLPTAIQSHESVDLLIAGANAKASRVAPCLAGTGADAPTAEQTAEAKLILIGAIRRWTEAGSGAVQTQTAGTVSQTFDTGQRTGYNLWPSEITNLQGICNAGTTAREAFSLDTAPSVSAHLLWCSLNFGALYCSCGVDIAGVPIFELG